MDFLKSLCGEEIRPSYRMKLMIVGQENVGKTSVLRGLSKLAEVKKEPTTPTSSTNFNFVNQITSELMCFFITRHLEHLDRRHQYQRALYAPQNQS